MSRPRARVLAAVAMLLLALAVVALVSGCGSVAGGGGGAPQVHIAFEKDKLPNGLEVILRKDDRLPVGAVNVWYHAGPAKGHAAGTRVRTRLETIALQG